MGNPVNSPSRGSHQSIDNFENIGQITTENLALSNKNTTNRDSRRESIKNYNSRNSIDPNNMLLGNTNIVNGKKFLAARGTHPSENKFSKKKNVIPPKKSLWKSFKNWLGVGQTNPSNWKKKFKKWGPPIAMITGLTMALVGLFSLNFAVLAVGAGLYTFGQIAMHVINKPADVKA